MSLGRHRRPLVTEINMAEYGDGRLTSSRDTLSGIAIYRRVLLFICIMNHIPPHLFLSREDNDELRDLGKHDCLSVLLQPMLFNANLLRMTKRCIEAKLDKYFNLVVRLRVSHRVLKRLEAVFYELGVELAN